MQEFRRFLYRFRGYILGIFALALIAMPAQSFSVDFSKESSVFECFILAFFLFAIGVLLRIKTRQYIGIHTRGSIHEAPQLITCGPYACIRHPLYLSNILIAFSEILFHLGPSPLFILCFFTTLFCFEKSLAQAEDLFLEQKFGDVWRKWASTTPAFFLNNLNLLKKNKCKKNEKSTDFKPYRTVFQAFREDWATWTWLIFFNLLLVLKKIYFS